ncbi:TRAP transporter small permease [Mesobacillus boroniphilus]|nr:TRAP transporter small permease subunit [Mesobacillus boroniphilus]
MGGGTRHIFMLLFMAILLFYCFTWITSSSVTIQRSSAILLPMWIPYAILPIGLLFATIHLISNLFDIIQNQHIDSELVTNLHAAAKESEEE